MTSLSLRIIRFTFAQIGAHPNIDKLCGALLGFAHRMPVQGEDCFGHEAPDFECDAAVSGTLKVGHMLENKQIVEKIVH